MKKIIVKSSFIFIFLLLLCGCDSLGFNNGESNNLSVLTSIYPTAYIVENLYTDAYEIKSIYPKNTSFKNYTLTNELLNGYSKSNIFVYNRTISNDTKSENDYAAYLINKNKNIKIIDASQGMTYTNCIEETWLNPSNYLMMASNIRKGLKEYISSYEQIKKIDDNYEKIKFDLTKIDAELKKASNPINNTLVVSNKCFKFLEKYGFKVISIEQDSNLNDKVLNEVKSIFANKNAHYIFIKDNEEESDLIKQLKNDYKVQTISLNTISSDNNDDKDYISYMNENINAIKLETSE